MILGFIPLPSGVTVQNMAFLLVWGFFLSNNEDAWTYADTVRVSLLKQQRLTHPNLRQDHQTKTGRKSVDEQIEYPKEKPKIQRTTNQIGSNSQPEEDYHHIWAAAQLLKKKKKKNTSESAECSWLEPGVYY